MRNRQTIMLNRQLLKSDTTTAEKGGVSKRELVRALTDAGYRRTLVALSSDERLPVVKGELCFEQLPSGLRVHCTDVIEESTGKSTSEMSACLSINFLLAGSVSYALDEQSFVFSADSAPQIFISAIRDKQIFTRFFNKGKRIRKLNISVTKAWLLERCNSGRDRQFIGNLFSQPKAVYHWPCSGDSLTLVNQLLSLHHDKSFEANLRAEQLAFQLFSCCYLLLVEASKSELADFKNLQLPNEMGDESYEQKLEQVLHQSLTLTQLSSYLGASVSTLQRYFKLHHKLTLKEYIRNQKLEYARRELLIEGKSIGEVAYFAGYNHVSNFVTAFKKYFSATPAELQKHYIK